MAQESRTSNKDLENLIETIENKYAPDKRVEIFSITISETDQGIALQGETSNPTAYNALLTEAKKIDPNLNDSIRVLPDEVIGEKNWGVIYNSVGTIRAKASYSSEMVSQVLLGMPVRILDKSGSWTRIQTPEGYIGWIAGSVQPFSVNELNEYMKKTKIMITDQYGQSYSKADKLSQPISDIVVGNMFTISGNLDNFYKVTYPDGREAFVEKQSAQLVSNWLNNISLTGESIVETSKKLMGVPYVWGGTSSKGLDCSGFTKMVYWLHGIIIDRDASQQVKNGIQIDSIGIFDKAQKGDLVFFGKKATEENPNERVIHVGIYIGDKKFIHASDYIHINSFDPDSEIYDEYNTNRYLRTMRYIGSESTKGITPIDEHPYYTKP